MGYQTEKLKNGSLLVRDVPLMGPQQLTETQFNNKSIDRSWMAKGIETFQKNKGLGKLPYLWDRHNSKDKAANVIGRLDNLRIGEIDGEPWYFADVIITDPAAQEKFLSGKTPSKSAEYQPDSYYFRGVALLDGHEGKFDSTIPDFVPEGLYEELVALGLDAECTVLCHAQPNTVTGESVMTKEEMQAMLKANNDTLLAAVDAKLSAQKPTVTASKTGDIDADLEAVREQARAEHDVKLAKVRRDAKITAYTAQLHAKTKTPENLITKKLSSFQTDEGMDTYFQSAMKQADSDVKLSIEREATGGVDIAESYDEYKRNYPNTTISLSQYTDLCKRAEVSHEQRFAGRKVHNVAFA